MNIKSFLFLSVVYMALSCNDQTPTRRAEGTGPAPKGAFGYDLSFLKTYDPRLVVLQNGDARLIVSPKYQAKVFTSTAEGDSGTSFGWVHYKAFEGPLDPHMNAYGGENRFWLGPEGGPFSVFFPKNAKMEIANWHTPAGFDSEPWELVSATDTAAAFRKEMQLTSYAGTSLHLRVDRRVSLLNREATGMLLNTAISADIYAVAYRTSNTVTNTGTVAWDKATGMPCTWILDIFPPSEQTTIIIPYKQGPSANPATTDYFGEIPPDRIKYINSVLYFKADGKMRGKLGMHPAAARNVAGSYDGEKNVLTIILYDVDPLGQYLNQEWRIDKPVFSGDAMNAYNDGPLADGSQMGPFYELESVSPAHYLPPGHSATHWHSVFHFTGGEVLLDRIAQQVLGVSVDQIKNAFK